MDGKQIYENFKQGNTEGLLAAADNIQNLQNAYRDRGESIKALQQRMASAWTGDAADAANAGAGPLEKAYYDSSDPLDATTKSVNAQAASFDASGHAVVEVPDKPDKPSAWSTGLKAAIPIAGPFMAANDVKNYQEGMAKYNEANETNVRVMNQYNDVTNTTKSTLPTQYGTLEADGAEVSINKPQPPIIEPHYPIRPVEKKKPKTTTSEENNNTEESSTKNNETTEKSGYVKPGTDDKTLPDNRGILQDENSRPPTLPGKDNTGTDDGTTKTAVKPGTGLPSRPTTLPPRTPVGETPGGDESLIGMPGLGGGQGPYGGTSTGVPGGSGGGRGPGSAGGRLLDSSGRPGVGGMGAEGEGRLGGGQRSGMGGLGNAAAQEAAAARAAGGRGGQMGPMGAGGRHAEGEEDDEHQRPDYLIEADPDAIFGTDQRTSPPVIGE